MVCIYCQGATQVTNSRPQKRLNQIWRRRKCTQCGALFTSEEIIDYGAAWRVQAAGTTLRPFHTQQLFISLYKSLEHRPTALADAEGLANTTISRLSTQTAQGVLETAQIAQTAYTVLAAFDAAAGVHYRAFHPAATAQR